MFCDAFTTVERATEVLMDNLDAPATAEPKVLRFTTGRRERLWKKNVVSLGLASGFLEPLESTSIHIIQSNVSRLVELFPDRGFGAANVAEYNRVVAKEYELIRDFLILHYARTDREDTAFWRHCKHMEVPDSLAHKLELFREGGRLFHDPDDLFRESSWVQVMMGQGVEPQGWHRHVDQLTEAQLDGFLGDVKTLIRKTVEPLPEHAEFVREHCLSALAD